MCLEGRAPPTASATDARCPSVRLCARQVRKGFPRRLRRHGGLPSEPCSGFHSRAGRVGAYAFFGVSPCCFFVPSLAARRPTDRTRTLDRMTHVGSIFGPSKSIPAGSGPQPGANACLSGVRRMAVPEEAFGPCISAVVQSSGFAAAVSGLRRQVGRDSRSSRRGQLPLVAGLLCDRTRGGLSRNREARARR